MMGFSAVLKIDQINYLNMFIFRRNRIRDIFVHCQES